MELVHNCKPNLEATRLSLENITKNKVKRQIKKGITSDLIL